MKESVIQHEDNANESFSLDLPYAKVRMPSEAIIEDLGDEILADKEIGVYINLERLSGHIYTVHGFNMFRCFDRYFVLAKVGNIHLPFYHSSQATDGKSLGWHAYFGFDGINLNKGSVYNLDAENRLTYGSSEIEKVVSLLNDNLAFPPDTLVTSYVRTGKKDSSGQDEYIVDAAAQIEADHENSPKVDRISRIMKLYNASTMNESHRFYRAGIHSDTLREPKRGLSRLADKLAVLKYRFALRYQLIRKDAADHKIAEHMELLDTYWLLREVTGYCLPHFLLQSQLSRSFYSNDNNFRNTVIAAI